MNIEELNHLSTQEAFEALFKCCGSTFWAESMVGARPFANVEDLRNKADRLWLQAKEKDALEAFTHHPKIGDLKSLQEKFATTGKWAGGEQAGVNNADMQVLEALAQGNADYEAKFGYIFIVCATGKSAEEMLHILQSRLPNDPVSELRIAMQEQHKITHIRLEKLLS